MYVTYTCTFIIHVHVCNQLTNNVFLKQEVSEYLSSRASLHVHVLINKRTAYVCYIHMYFHIHVHVCNQFTNNVFLKQEVSELSLHVQTSFHVQCTLY